MLWVVLVLVLALGALAVLVGYAVWLAHKTAEVLSEVGVLADQAARLGDLLAQVGAAEPGLRTRPPNGSTAGAGDVR
ncbi:MAG: hypothetical protein AVDCRST_MAG48-2270 [uncultured Friedmanniella sp.]|uniref:Uncharacterized protein n=1 Tax=uncultured Friedmanniella sp. TaxID=335381 RepID=A0A6J4KTE5_9ACTN|nr:MAG: hypothetical protein AVDCRST_MAG48-2270 [uncultured Friedmanniella sp.]